MSYPAGRADICSAKLKLFTAALIRDDIEAAKKIKDALEFEGIKIFIDTPNKLFKSEILDTTDKTKDFISTIIDLYWTELEETLNEWKSDPDKKV